MKFFIYKLILFKKVFLIKNKQELTINTIYKLQGIIIIMSSRQCLKDDSKICLFRNHQNHQ